MKEIFKSHWEYLLAAGGLWVWLGSNLSFALGIIIMLLTIAILALRTIVWLVRARIDWQNRNNPAFFKREIREDEEKYQKALSVCQEYLCRLEELQLPFPHRNYEIAAIALCSCLWAIAGTAAHLSPKKHTL